MFPSGMPKNGGAQRVQTSHPPARTKVMQAPIPPPAAPQQAIADFQPIRAKSKRLEELRGTERRTSIKQGGSQSTKYKTVYDASPRGGATQGRSGKVYSQNFVDSAYAMTQEQGISSVVPPEVLDAAWHGFMKSLGGGASGLTDPSTRRGKSISRVSSRGPKESDYSSLVSLPGYSLPTTYSSQLPTTQLDTSYATSQTSHYDSIMRDPTTSGYNPPRDSRYDSTSRDSRTRGYSPSRPRRYDSARDLSRYEAEMSNASSNPLMSIGRSISNAIGLTSADSAPLKRLKSSRYSRYDRDL